MNKFKIGLFGSGIDELIDHVRDVQNRMKNCEKIIAEKLAKTARDDAAFRFEWGPYDGPRGDTTVTVIPKENGYVVRAEGTTILFIEFGSGISYGGGHPEESVHGMGPGTYPNGKGNWDNPDGWHFKDGDEIVHTYGSPASMPMYSAMKNAEENIADAVKEVLGLG